MHSLIDLLLIKNKNLRRDQIEEVLSSLNEVLKENLKDGNSVIWTGLGTFTWKKKAESKKQAELWKEFPYEAEGEKVRFLPDSTIDGLSIKGEVLKIKKGL